MENFISMEKHFSNTSKKDLKRKIRSMDIWELTFKETSTTTTNFRHIDFNHMQLGDFRIFFNVVYTQLSHSLYNLTFR